MQILAIFNPNLILYLFIVGVCQNVLLTKLINIRLDIEFITLNTNMTYQNLFRIKFFAVL
jgi:hypothetical protein